MQPVGNVVFNLFNSDPARANSRSRGVQSQGCDQSSRRVNENKDTMPSMLRDVSSTLAHKTVGWISSLRLGDVRPVLLGSTLVNQFSLLFGEATTNVTNITNVTNVTNVTNITNADNSCLPGLMRSDIEKMMMTANCSAESASNIMKSMMDLAEDDSCAFSLGLGISAAAIGGALIGGVLAHKGIPAIKERLHLGNDNHQLGGALRTDGSENDDSELNEGQFKESHDRCHTEKEHRFFNRFKAPEQRAQESSEPKMDTNGETARSDELQASLAEDEKELDPMLTTDEIARIDELQVSLAEAEEDLILPERA